MVIERTRLVKRSFEPNASWSCAPIFFVRVLAPIQLD